MTAILVAAHDMAYVSAVTVNVGVVTTRRRDHASVRPHTNAPGIAWIWLASDFVSPIPLRLASDFPKIATTPFNRRQTRLGRIEKHSAHAVSLIMVALEIAVSRAFSGADLQI